MTRDAEPRVQFQLAMTLGNSKDRRALAVLVDLALQRAADPWFRTAILSSVAESASEFFDRLRAKRPSLDRPGPAQPIGLAHRRKTRCNRNWPISQGPR